MSLDADTARRSTAPGDVLVTEAGDVHRVAENDGENGYLAVNHPVEGVRELIQADWSDVDEYHHRDSVDVDELLEDVTDDDQEDVDDEDGEGNQTSPQSSDESAEASERGEE